MNEALEIVKNIIVALTASGVMSVIASLIIKSIFSKRSNLLDITQQNIIDIVKNTNDNLNTNNTTTNEQNKRIETLEQKLDIVIELLQKHNTRENKRSKQIEAIINEETKL